MKLFIFISNIWLQEIVQKIDTSSLKLVITMSLDYFIGANLSRAVLTPTKQLYTFPTFTP